MEKKDYRKKMLKYRVIILFVIIGLILDLIVIGISYNVYTNNMNASYIKIGTGISQVVASYVDGDVVADWIDGKNDESYYSIKKNIMNLRDSVPDIDDVYLYIVKDNKIQVMMDANTSFVDNLKPGKFEAYSGKWESYRERMSGGVEIAPIITDDESGWILASLKPIYNSLGECVCYAGCDISMTKISENRSDFMRRLSMIIFISTLLVILVAVFFVEKQIVYPINRMDVYLRNYIMDSSKKKLVKEKLLRLKVNSAEEIRGMRDDAVKLIDDITKYTNAAVSLANGSVTKSIGAVLDFVNVDSEKTKVFSSYAEVITDELRKNSKYKGIITDKYSKAVVEAAPLYDVGELFVPDSITRKKGKLLPEEYEQLKAHTTNGAKIIDDIKNAIGGGEYIDIAKQMANYHHERWDGKGYPEGLSGENIPLPARIIAIADVFNALISERSYKKAKSIPEAFDVIASESGLQFDPDVTTAFMNRRDDIEEIAVENMKHRGQTDNKE